MSVTDEVDAYKAKVTRWLKEIEGGDLRGTLLHGIATKAAKQFEFLLKIFLKRYMDSQDIDYERDVRIKVKGKKDEGLDALTLGQMIGVLDFLNSTAPKALVDAEARTILGRILESRNSLQHEPSDERELVVLAQALLGNIGKIMECGVFRSF